MTILKTFLIGTAIAASTALAGCSNENISYTVNREGKVVTVSSNKPPVQYKADALCKEAGFGTAADFNVNFRDDKRFNYDVTCTSK